MRGFNDGRESLHSNNGNIVSRKVWHEEVKARVASAKRTARSSTPFIPEFRKRSHAWLIQPSRLLYPSIKMPNIQISIFLWTPAKIYTGCSLVYFNIFVTFESHFFSNFQGHRKLSNNNGIYLSLHRRCWFSKTLSYTTYAW